MNGSWFFDIERSQRSAWKQLIPFGVVILVLVALCFICGCQDVGITVTHYQSSWSGLNRTVTLYSADGSVIKTWVGQFKIEEGASYFRFVDEGKVVLVSGTVVIEEN